MAADKQKIGKCIVCGEEKPLFYRKCEDCRAFMGRAERARFNIDGTSKVKLWSGTDSVFMTRPQKSVDDFQKEAQEHGMSYGQWQALQFIKNQRGKK